MVDEAHRMRNKNSALLGCLQQVVHNGMSVHAYQHRVLMTGTPMQNIKEELWPLMNFIDQANFPDLGRFQEKYCKGEPGHEVDEVCASRLAAVRASMLCMSCPVCVGCCCGRRIDPLLPVCKCVGYGTTVCCLVCAVLAVLVFWVVLTLTREVYAHLGV